MIKLTKINGGEIVINAELIEMVEKQVDTVITLYGKNVIRVKESTDDIIKKVIDYKRAINQDKTITEKKEGR